jgi:hypothetical protein
MNRFLMIALLAGTATSSVRAQIPAAGSQQIGPGTTSSLSPSGAKQVPANPHKILASALTPKTRATLQQAMDSNAEDH